MDEMSASIAEEEEDLESLPSDLALIAGAAGRVESKEQAAVTICFGPEEAANGFAGDCIFALDGTRNC